jgi:hypothetical protein
MGPGRKIALPSFKDICFLSQTKLTCMVGQHLTAMTWQFAPLKDDDLLTTVHQHP